MTSRLIDSISPHTVVQTLPACTRCGAALVPGLAIQNTLTGIGDFHDEDEVSTVSAGGPGRLVECKKCSDIWCGRRFTDTGKPFGDNG